MPLNPTGVFHAGTNDNLDAAKAACRKRAVQLRAKLANASTDGAKMLADNA